MFIRKRRFFPGQGIAEYAIIISLISAALISMNIYFKRSLQGRLKDMADNLISNEQNSGNDLYKSRSTAETNATSNVTLAMSRGGGRELVSVEQRDISSTGTSQSQKNRSKTGSLIKDTDVNTLVKPTRGNDTDYTDESWQKVMDKENALKRQLAYEDRAKQLREEADDLESEGQHMIDQANAMDCKGESSCEDGRAQMITEGEAWLKKAKNKREKAKNLDQKADNLNTKIDELNTEIGNDKSGDGKDGLVLTVDPQESEIAALETKRDTLRNDATALESKANGYDEQANEYERQANLMAQDGCGQTCESYKNEVVWLRQQAKDARGKAQSKTDKADNIQKQLDGMQSTDAGSGGAQ